MNDLYHCIRLVRLRYWMFEGIRQCASPAAVQLIDQRFTDAMLMRCNKPIWLNDALAVEAGDITLARVELRPTIYGPMMTVELFSTRLEVSLLIVDCSYVSVLKDEELPI